jgi:hypothetical protein
VRNFNMALPGLDVPPGAGRPFCLHRRIGARRTRFLGNVLTDLVRVSSKAAFATIATRPASKHLADGSNCHRIVQPGEWWIDRVKNCFRVVRRQMPDQNSVQLVLEPTLESTV